MSIIYFILMMGVIIFIHELGHFMTAKMFNVYCSEFAIGMGPKIFSKKIGETVYALRALPVGGFVQMAGEEGTDFDVPYERTIKGIKTWQKVIVMIAGSFMNILLAMVVFIGIFAYRGEVPVYGPAIIESVQENSPASSAGILPQDEVIQATFESGDVVDITDSRELSTQLALNPGTVELKIIRDGKEEFVSVTPAYNPEEERYMIGIALAQPTYEKINFFQSVQYGVAETWAQTVTIFDTLKNLIRGIGVENLSGPVGIFNMTSQSVQAGFLVFINLLGLLSLNIGVFNMLPLPVLDGGRILIVLIEKLTGRTLSEKAEMAIMGISFALLIGLMIFVTFNDLGRLFG